MSCSRTISCSCFLPSVPNANGLKAEKLRCVSNAVWKDIRPFEVVKLYFDEKKRVSLVASTGVSVELNEVSF